MNLFVRLKDLRNLALLLFAIFSTQILWAQTLPINLTTSFTGNPTRTFVLQTDNLLYETTSGSPVKLSSVLFSNITYDRDEFPVMQCTRQSDGVIIGFELRESAFKETLHTLVVNGVSYSLKANRDIYHVASNQKIGEQADFIRNENNHLIKVAKTTGNLFLYKGTPNTWEQVKQIATLNGVSYIVKTDNSLWAISLNYSQTLLGQNCRQILANDKNVSDELVILSADGTYKQYNWTSQTWCTFTPNVLSASPVAYEPGIWFVIQNQSALTTSHLGFKANSDGSITMAAIPATGTFDEFLWSSEIYNYSYRIRNKKYGTVLDLNTNPQIPALKTISTASTQKWNFSPANAAVYGTNAFTITNSANGTMLELQGNTPVLSSANHTPQQTWVVQPMDLVTGYRLPFNLGTAQEQAVYSKILKIPSGPFIYGTNTVTEWGVLMTYFVVQNMINAEKSKTSVGTTLQNHKVVLIGKDDTYPAVAFYPIISGFEQVKLLRGYSTGSTVTVVSEELKGRSGVVNSFVSDGYRKTDHVTHEFGHSMDAMFSWNGSNTIPNSSLAYYNSVKSELVANSVQAWFDDNSDGSYPDLPQTRQEQLNDEPAIHSYMAGKFNETNIWKPALQLRDYPQPTITGDPLVGKSGTAQTDLCNNAHVNPTPVASINPAISPLCAPAAVSFTISGTPDAIVTYSINGGTEQTVTLVNGTATISVNNPTVNQTLQLISVADASAFYSQTLSASSTIIVNSTLTPTLTAPNGNCVGSELSLAGAGTASHIQWQHNGTTVSTVTATSVAAASGTTVAGTGTAGNWETQLSSPSAVFVDGIGNLYVADQNNNRVQKWTPGATSGVTVASGLGSPRGIFVDGIGNVYIAEYNNHRIQKWAPGATSGITVAGGNGQGNAANQLSLPKGIYVDAAGNIFIADYDNHRIQKWAPGATTGTTVAGINGFGGADNQLGTPNAVFVDGSGNIYVAEQNYSRVKKFPSNSVGGTAGVIVATGSAPINGFYLDGAGNMYVSETANNQVKKYPFNSTNSTTGTIIAGGNGSGNVANQFNNPTGLFVDGSGNIFIADQGNHRVQKWAQTTSINATYSPTAAGNYTAIAITQNGCESTTSPALTVNSLPAASLGPITTPALCGPADVSFTINGTPDAVITYNINGGSATTATLVGGIATITISGASSTQTLNLVSVANASTGCSQQLNSSSTIVVNPTLTPTLSAPNGNCEGSPISIAGAATASHIQWQLNGSTVDTTTATSVAAAAGSTVAGTGTAGSGLNALNSPQGIFVDGLGNIFITDLTNHRVQKWATGATTGVTVAGGNGAGNGANQLNAPYGIVVDPAGNIYISDYWNHRVQMWAPGATSGITVAGGNGGGNAANQLSQPKGIYVDATSNIYIADYDNHRIQKWAPGATTGTTVAGGNGFGSAGNQLGTPNAVSIDAAGNIFVAEQNLNKVKRFPVNSGSSTNGVVVASATARINGFFMDGAGNMYVSETTNNQVKKFPFNSTNNTTGTIIAGGNGSGNGANQFNNPTGLFVDGNGNIFIADQGNHRVQKWAQTTSINPTYPAKAAGNYTAVVTTQNGCASTTSPAITITPAQQEIADGIDNNCNGAIDENSALHFDGVNDYVTISNAAFPAEMTFETWLKLDTKTSTARRAIFAWRSSTSALDLYAESDGTLRGFESNGSNLYFGPLPDNGWHHYALVRGAGTIKVYIDGILAGQGNSTQVLNIDKLTLGAAPDGSTYHMAGAFDELRVWNYAKSLSEIQADVNCAGAGPSGSLKFYFDFNEGVPNGGNAGRTIILNYSGNNLFGTLTNFALSGTISNFVDGYTGTDINVKGNSNTIISGDNSPSSSDNTAFGNTCVGTPLTKTFNIENVGTKVLNVTNITVGASANGFSTNFTSALAIQPGSSSNFTVSFNPTATGNYSDVISITSNDCDEAVYTFTVSGSSNCSPAAPDAPTFGTVTQPTCSTPTGDFTITNYNAAYTYVFSPNGPTISGAGNVTAATGSYTFTATSNGQTSSPSAQVTINAQPVSPATPTTGVVTHPTCSFSTGSFSITNFNSGLTYTFSPAGPTINGSGVVTATAGTYRVFASNGVCTSAQSNQVTINAQPATPATPTVGAVTHPTCNVATGSFTITNYNGGFTYSFLPTGPTINGSGLVTAGAGSYRITATQGGCTSSQSNLITINAQPATPPVPTIGAVTNPSCSGENGGFTVTNFSASLTYTFSPAGPTINGTGNVTAGAGTYTVTATNGSGCFATSGSITLTVTDNQPPTFSNSSLTAPPALALANVPEASGYQVIFEPNISVTKDYNNTAVDYLVNNGAATGVSYNRVAYFMQLDDKWVWVSMDKFNSTLTELGIPNAINNNVAWQQTVSNMNVFGSSNSNVTNGTGLNGNIEMWPHCYNPNSGLTGIPTGNNSKHDFNDFRTATNSCYGSFQVHNYSAAQTLFAYNAWEENGVDEMGIGNNPDAAGNPDWTFTRNIGSYTTKKLYILVNTNTGCPNNITVTASNPGGEVVSYITPVGSDNCSEATTTRTAGLASGSTFPVGTTTVTHRATDAAGNTTDCSFTVTVEYTNVPSVVTTSNGNTNYTEGSPATVDAGITVTDSDNANLASATVSITTGLQSTEDLLQFTNQNGITGTYNSVTGVLSLTGSATVANYQAALASVVYSNNAANPNTTNRTVTFIVNDGTDNSNAAQKTITITAVNNSPTLDAITNITVAQNAPAQTVNLAGITDGGDGGQTLTVTATSDNIALVPNPTVTYTSPNTTGSFSFTPVTGQNGAATITVTVSDDGGTANSGLNMVTRMFTITVTPIQITTGEAVRFDGNNDYVNVPNTTNMPQGNASRSVEAWVKTSMISLGNIVSWGNRNANGQRNSVAVRDGKFAFVGQNVDHKGTITINNGLWHYVVFTFQGSTLKLYVDGVLDITTSAAINTTGQDLRLGVNAQGSLSEFFNGTMDEVRIWNKVLTQTEITENYGKCSLSGTETGLIAYYRFNHGDSSGNNAGVTTLMDHSASGYNGTLTNFALTGSTSNWIAPGAPTCASYYRSITSGEWHSPNTWESSPMSDFSSGIVSPATASPDINANVISIRNGHIVTVTAPVTIDQTNVEAGGTLTVTGTTLTVQNNGLTIQSNVNGTGRIGNSNGTIAGNVTVERYIPAKRAWRLMTSPLTGTSNNTIYANWQNSGTSNGTGVEIWGPSGTGLANGLGYSMRKFTGTGWVNINNTQTEPLFDASTNHAFATFVTGPYGGGNIPSGAVATTLIAKGALRTGIQSYSNFANGLFAMVGNPYASPVDIDQVLTNSTGLQQKAWLFDPNINANSVGAYVVYDAELNTFTPSTAAYTTGVTAPVVQSGQAFFIKAANATNTLTFMEQYKSAAVSNAVFRTSNQTELLAVNMHRMQSGTPMLVDGVLGAFYNAGAAGVDGKDAGKISNTGENISLLRQGTNLSVEHRPLVAAHDTLYLRLYNIQPGDYHFTINATHMETSGLEAYLWDDLLQTSTPLYLGGGPNMAGFTVTTDAMSSGTRFRIIFRPLTILPVSLTGIKATRKAAGIQVDWATSSEAGIRHYDVERSADGRSFSRMATVLAKGNANNNNYQWLDAQPLSDDNYYRVRIVENGGGIKYSSVVRVQLGSTAPRVVLYPNPVTSNVLSLQMSGLQAGDYTAGIFNASGQQLHSHIISYSGGSASHAISLPKSIAGGSYILKLTAPGKPAIMQTFIVKQ